MSTTLASRGSRPRRQVCLVTGSTGGHRPRDRRAAARRGRDRRHDRGEAAGDIHARDLSRAGRARARRRRDSSGTAALDVLVNNVGGTEIRKLEELTDDDWQASFEINLMSAVRATRAALPGMRERGAGTIVNVSSTAAKRPSTGMPDYSVMKAALLSFSRLVADLYAKDGIRCNAVTPGPTATQAWLGDGRPRRPAGRPRGSAGQGRRRPAARTTRAAGGDRRGDRVPLLAARELRHRRRVERRRRHRPDHHLTPQTPRTSGRALPSGTICR